jgi:hypothetical protein
MKGKRGLRSPAPQAEHKRCSAEERGELHGWCATEGSSPSAASAPNTRGAGLMRKKRPNLSALYEAAVQGRSTEVTAVERRKRPPGPPRVRRPARP